jgi:aerobic carbon-monoxide dehydrogenase small subunit
VTLNLHINGKLHRRPFPGAISLIEYLRSQCGLTAANVGCDTGSCGACTVLIDRQSVKACSRLAVQENGRHVVTLEGPAEDEEVRRVIEVLRDSFHRHHALQCGYCTPGMVLAAAAFLLDEADLPTDAAVRRAIDGQLCRCTGYVNIVQAIKDAAEELRPCRC